MRARSSATGSNRARDHEIVTDHDRVPAFFGGPPARPLAPGIVFAEPVELGEVQRKIVLGQQVDGERGRAPPDRARGRRPTTASPLEYCPRPHGTYSCGNHSFAVRQVSLEQRLDYRKKFGSDSRGIHDVP